MTTIAILTSPAIRKGDEDLDVRELSKLSRLSRSLRAGARFWVRPECRKIACGMIVAPTMPTAMVNAPASGSSGTTLPTPAAAPIDRRDEYLGEIAKSDGADEARR